MEYRAPSFFEAVVRGFRLYFRFSGRDTRAHFWPFVFVATLIPGIITFATDQVRARQVAAAYPDFPQDLMAGVINERALDAMRESPAHDPFPLAWFTIATILILIIPYSSAVVRRLHDIGLRGWWLFPQILMGTAVGYVQLSVIGNPIQNASEFIEFFRIALLLNLMLLLWTLMLVYFVVQDGDYGANRFGLDPKHREFAK
ncbi:DUF805 domain-containing protein [Parasphingopyxis sp. CP4]|uniref:DUF805 domain-containing protein n=1 Tax=Parasphingopyxis sp. CP4 TaxID=2724527 RepID=UPI0015A1EED3|nr:DUF805 domain-containing protein [Parasphingopyxis sp. CP4]QLC20957.1 DUF805 domain-containing protein [Parasphingopyxis sp. CP4]